MAQYTKRIIGVLGLWLGVVLLATAQIDRDQFAVISPTDLAENPQRYWSRGIVFEDAIESVSARTRHVAGRRMASARTRTAGEVQIKPDTLAVIRDADRGDAFLFAGTVLSETARTGLGRRQPRYYVMIDVIEPVMADSVDDLLAVLHGEGEQVPAFKQLLQAVTAAQNELLARSRNEDIEMAALFERAEDRLTDPATDAARAAVRALEADTGTTSTEMLSQIVRGLLTTLYLEQPPSTPATKDDAMADPLDAENTLD